MTDDPIDWEQAKTAEASREGATGVIFVSDAIETTLVAKFLTSDEAARALFARRIFERLKVATPMARALSQDETEKLQTKLRELSKDMERNKANRFLDVLGKGGGKIGLVAAKVEDAQTLYSRMMTKTEKASGEESGSEPRPLEVADAKPSTRDMLLRLLDRSELGVFIAADAFLGNKDRMEAANLGNILVTTKDAAMHAIDNDTLAIALSYKDRNVSPRDAKEWTELILKGAAVGSGMTGLEVLSNDPAVVMARLGKVLGLIKARLGTSSGFDADALVSLNIDDVAASWVKGITETKQMLSGLAAKQPRAELKHEFRHDAPRGEPSAKFAWPALRVRLKYLELQQQGFPPEKVNALLEEFVAERQEKWRGQEKSIAPEGGAEETPPKPAALGPRTVTTPVGRGGVPKLTGVPTKFQTDAPKAPLVPAEAPESSNSGSDSDNDESADASSREEESSKQSSGGSTG